MGRVGLEVPEMDPGRERCRKWSLETSGGAGNGSLGPGLSKRLSFVEEFFFSSDGRFFFVWRDGEILFDSFFQK